MNNTLRSRLLISFGLLILVMLCLFSIGTLAVLLRNPLIYESAAQQLRTAQQTAHEQALLRDLPADLSTHTIEQTAAQLKARVVLASATGEILADSQAQTDAALHIQPALIKILAQRNEIGFLRDESRQVWLVLVQIADENTFAILAVQRPRLAAVQLFKNDYFRPVVTTGIIGLGLATVLSLVLVKWINAPLQRIGKAADAVAAGEFKTIPSEGPTELRHLADSFNSMVQHVQDAQQAQRDLTANVSHELKTPLTSIQGFSYAIMEGDAQTPDEIHQAAQVIYNESRHLNRLAQDLVTLAKFEAGVADLHLEEVDISALIREVAEKFRPLAIKAGLQFSLEVPPLPRLIGDKDRLNEMFSNLVDNAIQYNAKAGNVAINASVRDDYIEIRIADNGAGISASEREHIFQRYYRADHSHPGMGLGLAITNQIVAAHGGSIQIEDNLPHGSIFVVDLPLGNYKFKHPL